MSRFIYILGAALLIAVFVPTGQANTCVAMDASYSPESTLIDLPETSIVMEYKAVKKYDAELFVETPLIFDLRNEVQYLSEEVSYVSKPARRGRAPPVLKLNRLAKINHFT